MTLLFFILAVALFVVADILIRHFGKKIQEKKAREEREKVLSVSLKLDFSKEAKTLKRVEVDNPKARILCVDDEAVILDSFRKILVIDGFSVDTVESGKEALRLIQMHHYDFVFTDLKMPEMDGVEVTKAVKHLRPDIDVVIITGYATVETAVECMKYGALDYVQKPFTEDELVEFTRKCLIRRQDRIRKQLKPKVHITHYPGIEPIGSGEFAIPGGVFISSGHCWASLAEDGTVKVGIDDFAKKLIGKITDIELPNLGMNVKKGQPLFTVRQENRSVTFNSPVSGQVAQINTLLKEDIDSLDITPYDKNWVCVIDADNIDSEIPGLKVGKSAVNFYQDEIEHVKEVMNKLVIKKADEKNVSDNGEIHIGELEKLDDFNWEKITKEFFSK
ncbi:MAG: hypothetical protein Kow0098_19260 [Ignavibacteriaceae bacterium]